MMDTDMKELLLHGCAQRQEMYGRQVIQFPGEQVDSLAGLKPPAAWDARHTSRPGVEIRP